MLIAKTSVPLVIIVLLAWPVLPPMLEKPMDLVTVKMGIILKQGNVKNVNFNVVLVKIQV